MSVENSQVDGDTHHEKITTADTHAGRAGRAPPTVTDHARRRWAERAPSAEIGLTTVWKRSIAVGAPQQACDVAQLYAPQDVVLRLQNGRITSVWPANYDTLDTGHLGRCTECGNLGRFDDPEQTCQWCQCQASTVEMDNGVTVRFTGGQ
jgi:hypothetical protein